jgi:spore coat protein JC
MPSGGPDGELAASLRYLSQRFSMPYPELKAILTDIGTEELDHFEIIGSIVHQLTRNLTEAQFSQLPFASYFVDHTAGVYPVSAAGNPFTAAYIGVKGDIIADLTEDMAAEQKARVTYDNILRLSDDPDVNNVIRFLREREVVHFQRFGEALRIATDRMDQKNVYATNPAFDKPMSNIIGANVSPMKDSNLAPLSMEKSNVSPSAMEKSNVSPLSMEKPNVSPLAMEKSNASPSAMEKTGLSPATMNKSNVSPMITDNKGGANPMSNRADRLFERSWMDK